MLGLYLPGVEVKLGIPLGYQEDLIIKFCHDFALHGENIHLQSSSQLPENLWQEGNLSVLSKSVPGVTITH